MQNILSEISKIKTIIEQEHTKKIFLVCGKSMEKLPISDYLKRIQEQLQISITTFMDYTPNPKIESVEKGVLQIQEQKCDFIIAVGGGSAIDVAKCIKQRVNQEMQREDNTHIKMLAMPTTAGTGSESTQFAVIYVNGEKTSVDDETILPEYVILDASLLESLPDYQKKATLMDALCQAIESIWARKATENSRKLASDAIRLIRDNGETYLYVDVKTEMWKLAANAIMKAANLAGQAINITRTTAAHAMSYKITSLYGAAHGHAVAICLPEVWKFMIKMDADMPMELAFSLELIADAMGCKQPVQALYRYEEILEKMEFPAIVMSGTEELEALVDSVNEQRLGNHPAVFQKADLRQIYKYVLHVEK